MKTKIKIQHAVNIALELADAQITDYHEDIDSGVIQPDEDSMLRWQEGLEAARPLILAAPDLLLACKTALIELSEDEDYHKHKETIKLLQRTIKKAEKI